MWWQYLIVAIVVGGCVLYLARGLFLVIFGKRSASCGGCNCAVSRDVQSPRLGTRREIIAMGIDKRGDSSKE